MILANTMANLSQKVLTWKSLNLRKEKDWNLQFFPRTNANNSENDTSNSEDPTFHESNWEIQNFREKLGISLNISHYGYSLCRDLSTFLLFPAQNTWRIAATELGLIISCLPADSDWHPDAVLHWRTILKAAFTGMLDVMHSYF